MAKSCYTIHVVRFGIMLNLVGNASLLHTLSNCLIHHYSLQRIKENNC